MAYVRENNIILEINEKAKVRYYYTLVYSSPLYCVIWQNNIEIVKLLMAYADENHMTLNINEYCNDSFPLLLSIVNNNNIEIIKLLIKYAEDHHIILKINQRVTVYMIKLVIHYYMLLKMIILKWFD